MTNRLLLPLVVGAIAPSLCSAQDAQKPNIIFILADDLGYGDISCYNTTKLIQTPNIDRIADRGVMMRDAYAYPVSAPTRSAFLTGSQAHEVGVYGNGDSDIPGVGDKRLTFTPLLQEQGYATAWFGKWHQGYDLSNHPMNNGFDVAYGFLGGMHDFYDSKEGSFYNGGPYSQYSHVYDGFMPVKEIGYLTETLTDRAINFIDDNRDNPFYIYLAYNAPHTPVQAPDSVILKYLKMGHDAIAATRYAMIDVMDQQIGRILNSVEEQGLENNTMIVFMSDNGPELEENSGGFRGTKFTLWEGGVRVPLIASYPGVIPEGTESNSICGIYDMATTFVKLASGDEMSFGTGEDLLPYFQMERNDNVRDEFIIAINPNTNKIPYTNKSVNQLMIRSKEWKLVRDRSRTELALYNLERDPAERVNVYDKHPLIVNKLMKIADDILVDCPMNSARQYNKSNSSRIKQAHIDSY